MKWGKGEKRRGNSGDPLSAAEEEEEGDREDALALPTSGAAATDELAPQGQGHLLESTG